MVTVDLLDSSPIYPREVFADAIAERAVEVIPVHNHPPGLLEPTPQDLEATRRLAEARRIWGSKSWTISSCPEGIPLTQSGGCL